MRDFSAVVLGESNLTAVILSSVTNIVTAPGEHLLRNLVLVILVARWRVVRAAGIICVNTLAFIPTCWWAA
jgi:hypothetical protein